MRNFNNEEEDDDWKSPFLMPKYTSPISITPIVPLIEDNYSPGSFKPDISVNLPKPSVDFIPKVPVIHSREFGNQVCDQFSLFQKYTDLKAADRRLAYAEMRASQEGYGSMYSERYRIDIDKIEDDISFLERKLGYK